MIRKQSLKDKKRITYFFFLITILFVLNTKIILGATNTTAPLPPFPTNPQATTSTDISNLIIQENIKTRMEIKQYCDQKIASMIDTVKTQGAEIIGQNFAEFDRRIHELSQKIFVKAIIGTFTTILLACLVYYIIKRRIEKKHMPRAMNFKEISVSPTQIGLIAEPMKTELTLPIPRITPQAPTIEKTPTIPPTGTQTTSTTNELPTFPQTELSPPTPTQNLSQAPQKDYQLPIFPELQQPIILSPREREQIIKEQEEINKKKRKEAEKKLAKLIDEHNKNAKIRNKLKKKLDKPEKTKLELEAEQENIKKEIDEISKEYNITIPRA